MSAVATAPSIWERASDSVAPRVTGGGWRCNRPDCDGQPHDGWANRHARAKQLAPPGDWYLWVNSGGRGTGKTRSGAEWLLERMRATPRSLWFMIGETWDDGRDVMVEGESGLIACLTDAERDSYVWNSSLGHFRLGNGAQAHLFSAEKPSKTRGPNLNGGWGDEPAKWRYGIEVWDTLQFALRKGDPRVCMTGTPANVAFYRRLVKEADVITVSHTEENLGNLSDKFKARVIDKYRDTRLGRQELAGELLEDVPGALWTPGLIDVHRWPYEPMPAFSKVIVAVDPNVSEGNDECGIMVCGREDLTLGPRAGVLEDASTAEGPRGWAKRVVEAYHDWEADEIVAEKNNGGDLVELTIHGVDPLVPVRLVHASRGKETRAQPVATLTESDGWGFYGLFPKLEDELTGWVPGRAGQKSPNRLDAMVWGAAALLLDLGKKRRRRRLHFGDGDTD